MNVLYIEDNAKLRDLYVMKLEADFKAQVTEVSNEEEAIITLQEDDDYQLILFDLDVISKRDSSRVYDLVKNSEILDIPFVLISSLDVRDYKGLEDFRNDHRGNRLITKPVSEKTFKSVIADAMSCLKIDLTKDSQLTNAYTPVKIHNFTRFNKLPVEVFIKLSETKYLKLINPNDIYSSEVIEKYVGKGVNFLYVRENEYPILADTGIKTLLQLYDRKISKDKVQDVQLMAIEDLHHALHSSGIDDEVVELTKKTVESSVTLIKRNRNIAQLLNNMKKQGSYIYDHSLKLSYISIAIAKKTEWSSDNTCFKLSLAAMMHDMTLTDNDLAKFDSLDDPGLEGYSEEKIKEFSEHPTAAAAMIRDNKQMPSDIDFIVAEHHEKPGGDGFPRGLSKLRISPLGCVFVLAHQFLNRMDFGGLKYNRQNMEAVISALKKEEFDKGNFKKPFAGLVKTFLPEEK